MRRITDISLFHKVISIIVVIVLSAFSDANAGNNKKYDKIHLLHYRGSYKKIVKVVSDWSENTWNESDPRTRVYIGDAYYFENHKDKGLLQYSIGYSKDGTKAFNEQQFERFCTLLIKNSEYNRALSALNLWKKNKRKLSKGLTEVMNLATQGSTRIETSLKRWTGNPDFKVSIETLPHKLKFPELGFSYYNNQLVYSDVPGIDHPSREPSSMVNEFEITSAGENKGLVLYQAPVRSKDNVINEAYFAKRWHPQYEMGNVSFSPDYKQMYYSRKSNRKSVESEICMSVMEEGVWVDKGPVRKLNKSKYSSAQPALSPDGTKLYFSSNRPEGYGGWDLYVSKIDSKGKFSKPENLGTNINTAGNERYPSVLSNDLLIFSSDGLDGYGGLDLFFVYTDNPGRVPVNFFRPINSKADDYGLIFDPHNRNHAWYLTENVGGSAEIKDVLWNAAIPYNSLSDGSFVAVKEQVPRYEKPQVKTEPKPQVVKKASVPVPEVTRKKNLPKVAEVTKPKTVIPEPDTSAISFPQVYSFTNVHFKYNDYRILENEIEKLNMLADFLKKNRGKYLVLAGHADFSGQHVYNVWLSMHRTNEIRDYLVKKGVPREQIGIVAMGSTDPIEEKNISWTNRRVELFINDFKFEHDQLAIYYTKPGDSLESLAKKFSLGPDILKELNPFTDEMKPGSRMFIPVNDIYLVDKGEMVWQVAGIYKIHPKQVYYANDKKLNSPIKENEILYIPLKTN